MRSYIVDEILQQSFSRRNFTQKQTIVPRNVQGRLTVVLDWLKRARNVDCLIGYLIQNCYKLLNIMYILIDHNNVTKFVQTFS